MKYYSRLIALLLAVMMLMTNIVMASGINMNDLTLTELESMYAVLADDEVTYPGDVLGSPCTMHAFSNVYDKAETEFVWYDEFSTEPIATGDVLTVEYTMSQQKYTCKAVKQGKVLDSQVFIILPAQVTDVEKYVDYLWSEHYYICIEEERSEQEYIQRAYNLMRLWDFEVTENENLAAKVLIATAAVDNEYNDPIICTCYLSDDGQSVIDPAIVKAPYEQHDEDCLWYEMTMVDPTDPDQPPLYEGKPEGNQYTETLEYTLPMEEDRAVILQTGARAILTSESTTPGVWQVYTGNEWVDIQGDNTNVIEVTEAKLNTIFELTGIAQLRYFDKANSVVLDEVSVTTKKIADGDYFPLSMQNQTLTLISRAIWEPATDSDPDTYTVRIIYRLDDTVIRNTTVGVYAPGEVPDVSVDSPVIQGYKPVIYNFNEDYTDHETVDATTIEIDGSTVTGDRVYNVYYVPDFVPYTVRYMLQSLDNPDVYPEDTEKQREYKNKKTGETAAVSADDQIEIPGFYYIMHTDPATIVSTGETKLEIYYNRAYYLMTLNLDGGYGVDSIYAAYEAPISVGTPSKAGHTFEGWTWVDEKGVAQTSMTLPYVTMPAKNTTFTAKWKAADSAKVSIVFWGENPNDEKYSYLHTSEIEAKPGTVLSYNGSSTVIVTCGSEEHTHGADCEYNCGETEHTHTLENGCYTLNCSETSHDHATDGCTLSCTHTHTLDCYDAGSYTLEETNKPTDNLQHVANGIYTYNRSTIIGTRTGYCVNIGDKWYYAREGRQEITLDCSHTTHSDACYTCGKTNGTHTHSVEGGCYTLTCTTPLHTHSDSCGYSCGKTAHSHSDSCYTTSSTLASGLDSSLWTLVKSDTVTVAADGSTVVNVYYDRTTYNIRFYRSTNANLNNYIYIIEAKWGQNISSHWPIKNATDNNDYTNARWDDEGTTSLYDEVLVFIEIMPAESFRLYYSSTTNGIKTMYYYVEALPGAEYEATYTYSGTTKYFVKAFEELKPYYGMFTEDEDFFPLRGFDKWTSDPRYTNGQVTNKSTIRHYYTRHTYSIVFYNPTELIKTETGVPYEAELGEYNFEPTPEQAPAQYEPGSVEFVGWYLNPECTGDEYILEDNTMPAGEKNGEITLSLYAKWELVEHKVNIYKTSACNAEDKIGETQVVQHGKKATAPETPTHPSGQDYRFVDWFYMDNGVEKAFDFANMPVNKDMDVYAKWSSSTLVDYTVRYVIKVDGKEVEIADPVTRRGLAGSNPDVYPKKTEELYEEYQNPENGGYFPVIISDTLELQLDESKNVYTFEYIYRDSVPYTVYYLVAADKKLETTTTYGTKWINGVEYYLLAASENKSTTQIAVTEVAKPIPSYLATEYQKTLIINGATDAVNEICFFYEVNNDSTYWYITHYIEDPNGTHVDSKGNKWTQYTQQYGIGKIGDPKTATQIDITDYTYWADAPDNFVSGELELGKVLELELYYTEDTVTIQYAVVCPAGAETVCKVDPSSEIVKIRSGEAKGSTASTSSEAYEFVGWYGSPYGDDLLETDAFYQPEQVGGKHLNKTYYARFVEKQVTITYIPVGNGAVSRGSETINILTGSAQGSTALPQDNYHFVGWYTDEACKNEVSTDVVYKPTRPGTMWESATYYAKFEENEVTINYIAVTKNTSGEWVEEDATGGTVQVGNVAAGATATDTVAMVTGDAKQAEADPNDPTYKFVGWYTKDANDVNDVYKEVLDADGNHITTPTFVPEKPGEFWESTTYYALFDWNMGSLTITKEGLRAGESAIFKVEAESVTDGKQTYYIVLSGNANNSATITNLAANSEYTVTEQSDWSWAYTPKGNPNKKGKITAGATETETFTNNKTDKWLHDENGVLNDFKADDNDETYGQNEIED